MQPSGPGARPPPGAGGDAGQPQQPYPGQQPQGGYPANGPYPPSSYAPGSVSPAPSGTPYMATPPVNQQHQPQPSPFSGYPPSSTPRPPGPGYAQQPMGQHQQPPMGPGTPVGGYPGGRPSSVPPGAPGPQAGYMGTSQHPGYASTPQARPPPGHPGYPPGTAGTPAVPQYPHASTPQPPRVSTPLAQPPMSAGGPYQSPAPPGAHPPQQMPHGGSAQDLSQQQQYGYQQQQQQQQQQQPGQQQMTSPVGGPPSAGSTAGSSRRRMYPEQMARAYSPGVPSIPPGGGAAAPNGMPGQNGAPHPGMQSTGSMPALNQAMAQMNIGGGPSGGASAPTSLHGSMASLPQQPGYPGQQQPQYPGQQQPQYPGQPQPSPMGPPGVMSPQSPQYQGMPPAATTQMGGMLGPQGAPGSAQRSRIDPNQIPSPVAVQENDQQQWINEPYRTCSKQMPPLASSVFRVLDEGNCSTRFLRMTTYNIPATEELLAQSMMPLAAVVQPFAELEAGEAPVAVIETPESGPIRCRRCRAYINPFMPFIDGGRKFTCNFCMIQNDVPSEYFCNLDMSGRRVDIMQRPELRYGTVDYVATKDFIAKEPKPVAIVIAIDVSWNAVQCGLLAQAAKMIRDWLYAENAEQRFPKGAQVGLITYDRAVHFYNFHPSLDQYQMLIVPDVEDMFVPLSTGFMVDPFESRSVIEPFLDALPTMFAENRTAESVIGSVAQAVVKYLDSRGGRLLAFHTTLPGFGPGELKSREDPKLYGTDKEKTLFVPQDSFYKGVAEAAVAAGVSIDLYLFPFSYMDVATLGVLSMITGGETRMYPQFNAERDGAKLHTDFMRGLTRPFAYNALMRVRASQGLRVVDHFGNFYTKDGVDLELAGIDSDKAIGVALKHEGKLDEKGESALQIAILHTTSEGQRRIRVMTASFANTNLLGNVFRFAELDTTVNFLAKTAVTASLSTTLSTVRLQLTEKCVKVLASYRRNCASSTSPGQLILPETFKLFPLFTLALHKSRALRAGDMQSDLRVAAMRELKAMPVVLTIPLLYPRMIALHADPEPATVRVSYERLEPHGCYLVENGQHMMLWVGRNVPDNVLQQLFGVASADQIDIRTHVLATLDNPINQRVQRVLQSVFNRYHRHLSFQIVRQGLDQAELEFVNHMIEDKNHDAMSYVDFLVYVHRQIHAEIRGSQ